jgi:hypothetical protein
MNMKSATTSLLSETHLTVECESTSSIQHRPDAFCGSEQQIEVNEWDVNTADQSNGTETFIKPFEFILLINDSPSHQENRKKT